MKKQNIVLSVLLIVVLGNLLRTQALSTIRTVDFLQILVCGALLGALIASAFRKPETKQGN